MRILKKDDWVVLLETNNIEAEIVKTILDSSGIKAILTSDVTQSVHPFATGPLAEVNIMVRAEEEMAARELLAEMEDGQDGREEGEEIGREGEWAEDD
ncbi:MAG: DUF2007 domain-containing protein [Halanaerobium sp.]|nr:DUF2007 domain-containing protein [Halanaerobium sp.]